MYHFYSVSIIFARDLFTAMHQFFFPGFDVQNSCFSNYFSRIVFLHFLFQEYIFRFHGYFYFYLFFHNGTFPICFPGFSYRCFFQVFFPEFMFPWIVFWQFFLHALITSFFLDVFFPELVFPGVLFFQYCILPIFSCTFCMLTNFSRMFSRIGFSRSICPDLYFANFSLHLLLISFFQDMCFFRELVFPGALYFSTTVFCPFILAPSAYQFFQKMFFFENRFSMSIFPELYFANLFFHPLITSFFQDMFFLRIGVSRRSIFFQNCILHFSCALWFRAFSIVFLFQKDCFLSEVFLKDVGLFCSSRSAAFSIFPRCSAIFPLPCFILCENVFVLFFQNIDFAYAFFPNCCFSFTNAPVCFFAAANQFGSR